MTRRAWWLVAALATVCALLGVASFSPRGASDSAPPARSPEALPPGPSRPSAASRPRDELVTTTLATAAAPPDAEQLLRELEPLAVSDPPQALARALAADERLSPEGVYAQARRALIITLLVDTGRMRDARERTRDFMRRYPSSQYLPLVQGATGIHPRPRPSQLRDAAPAAR